MKVGSPALLLILIVPIALILLIFFNPTIRHIFLVNNGSGKITQTSKDSSIVTYEDNKNGLLLKYDNQIFYLPIGGSNGQMFELKGDHCIPRFFIDILDNPQSLSLSDFISTKRRYVNPKTESVTINEINGIKVTSQSSRDDDTQHDFHYHFSQKQKVIDFFYSDSNRKKHTPEDCQKDETVIKSTINTVKFTSGS